jgi:hypothetical protein
LSRYRYIPLDPRTGMTPRERELLQGMGNCYAVCGEDFRGTTRMVAGARGLTQGEVLKMLNEIKEKYARDQEYRTLRARLPEDFPM